MSVYYNGSCNICDTEIGHYKKKTSDITYVDISCSQDPHIEHLNQKELYRRMHVFYEGKLYSGSESFLILWSKIPNFQWLSKFLGMPIFRQLWFIGYEILAFFLFIKNYYIQKR